MGIGIEQLLLVDLLFGVGGLCVHEIHGQVEERFLLAIRQHVFNRGQQRLRLQVAAAQSVAAGVQPWHVLDAVAIVIGPRPVTVAGCLVFQALGEGGAHFAHQWQVFGQRLVNTFQHGHSLFAFQQGAKQLAGKGPEHGDVDHTDLDVTTLPQVIGHGLGLHDHAALAQDHVLRIVHAVAA